MTVPQTFLVFDGPDSFRSVSQGFLFFFFRLSLNLDFFSVFLMVRQGFWGRRPQKGNTTLITSY